ncbi:hypothetical protein BDA99DRAFT_513358, partial [Phascolomyces articulosus]
MSRSSVTLHNDDIVDDEATVAPTTITTTTTSIPHDRPQEIEEQPQSTLDHEPILCTRCQKSATFMCSLCGLKGPRYCSVECQKVDWKESHY